MVTTENERRLAERVEEARLANVRANETRSTLQAELRAADKLCEKAWLHYTEVFTDFRKFLLQQRQR